jgi:hypothetical protein
MAERRSSRSVVSVGGVSKEEAMPVFILWAVPAAIVLAGGTYLVFLK